MRSVLLAILVCSCTADQASTQDGGDPCPPPVDCGPVPAQPEFHPTWTTINNQTVLVFNEADGRALVAWTYQVTAWQECKQ